MHTRNLAMPANRHPHAAVEVLRRYVALGLVFLADT
jgi:hypothetical protein